MNYISDIYTQKKDSRGRRDRRLQVQRDRSGRCVGGGIRPGGEWIGRQRAALGTRTFETNPNRGKVGRKGEAARAPKDVELRLGRRSPWGQCSHVQRAPLPFTSPRACLGDPPTGNKLKKKRENSKGNRWRDPSGEVAIGRKVGARKPAAGSSQGSRSLGVLHTHPAIGQALASTGPRRCKAKEPRSIRKRASGTCVAPATPVLSIRDARFTASWRPAATGRNHHQRATRSPLPQIRHSSHSKHRIEGPVVIIHSGMASSWALDHHGLIMDLKRGG